MGILLRGTLPVPGFAHLGVLQDEKLESQKGTQEEIESHSLIKSIKQSMSNNLSF